MDSSPEPEDNYVPESAVNQGPESSALVAPFDLMPAALPPVNAVPAPSGNRFFFGRFGLRAGYGIAIVLITWGILATLAGLCGIASIGRLHDVMNAQAYAHAHPTAPKIHLKLDFVPKFVIVQDGITFFGLLGACWLFSRGERRPLRAYGIGSYRVADVLPGAFWGVAIMSALVATLYASHLLVFDGRALFGATIFLYGAKWLLAFLLVGLAEEYAFRGYVQYTLMRGVWGLAERLSATSTRAVAFWLAACTFSLLFTLAHTTNGGENFFGLVQVFLAGVTFAYALWRTGSLWWAIGFHMTWDWAQSFLFGVADSGNVSVGRLFVTHPQGRTLLSGGADGPEGSLFATVALLLTIVIIRFTTRPGMQPALEQAPKPMDDAAPPLLHNSVA